MTGPANRDQAEYWAADAGPKWVGHQAQLDSLMAPVLNRLLAAAEPRSGDAVLDIGCGTGASTLALADAVGGDGQVTGIDISPPLLEMARERARAAGLMQVEFVLADAQTHPFPESGFDMAVSRFGVMFFEDPPSAFHNIARTLKPGAAITFVAWTGLDENPWFGVPMRSAENVLGPVDPPPPNAPGPMAFQDRAYVHGILDAAGLTDIRTEKITPDLTPPGTLADIAGFATRVGPASRAVREQEADAKDIANIAAGVAEALKSYADPEGVRVPATLNLCSARRV